MSLHTTITRSLALGAVAGSLLLGSAKAANENVSASISLDFNSHFMSYGFNVYEDRDIGQQSLLFQPSASLKFALSEGSAIYTGVWADVNNRNDGSGYTVEEVDAWIGYYFTVDKFVIDFTLQQWMYADEVEGIFDVKVSYDTMFSPYIKAHTRIEAVGNQKRATIFEVGGTLYQTTLGSVSLSVPVAGAFSFSEYHGGEDGYAYSLVGLSASMPLGIPDSYGAWDLHGGLTFYHTDKAFTGNERSNYLTLNVGVGLSF